MMPRRCFGLSKINIRGSIRFSEDQRVTQPTDDAQPASIRDRCSELRTGSYVHAPEDPSTPSDLRKRSTCASMIGCLIPTVSMSASVVPGARHCHSHISVMGVEMMDMVAVEYSGSVVGTIYVLRRSSVCPFMLSSGMKRWSKKGTQGAYEDRRRVIKVSGRFIHSTHLSAPSIKALHSQRSPEFIPVHGTLHCRSRTFSSCPNPES